MSGTDDLVRRPLPRPPKSGGKRGAMVKQVIDSPSPSDGKLGCGVEANDMTRAPGRSLSEALAGTAQRAQVVGRMHGWLSDATTPGATVAS